MFAGQEALSPIKVGAKEISIALAVRSLDRSYREIITGGLTTASFDSYAFSQSLPFSSPADSIFTPSSILRATFSGLAPSRNATLADSQAFFHSRLRPRHFLRIRRIMSIRQTERKSHIPGTPFRERKYRGRWCSLPHFQAHAYFQSLVRA